MSTARESINKLAMIMRHIDIIADNDLNIDNLEELKYWLHMWASTARQEGRDALAPLEALVSAIEDGVEIDNLKEYKDLQRAYAEAGD